MGREVGKGRRERGKGRKGGKGSEGKGREGKGRDRALKLLLNHVPSEPCYATGFAVIDYLVKTNLYR